MESAVLGGPLREENLLAGYFFYGEETFLVEEFLADLKTLLASASTEEFHLERFYLGETKWAEIMDAARTAPFLFHSWRVLTVWIPERS